MTGGHDADSNKEQNQWAAQPQDSFAICAAAERLAGNVADGLKHEKEQWDGNGHRQNSRRPSTPRVFASAPVFCRRSCLGGGRKPASPSHPEYGKYERDRQAEKSDAIPASAQN